MASAAKTLAKLPRDGHSVSVAEAKATLSALLTGVAEKNRAVTILRRGVPIAQLVPFPAKPRAPFLGAMRGTGRILGDIITPYMDEWTVGDE